ncbi:MAG: aldo/keto reductase [Acidimicrobiia bacterium]|nr:aldo/keto reductase [Acidimicrobiia bacterium]
MTENLVDAAPRNLGMSDITVGPLAFGCWRLVNMDVTAARANVETALAAGMNLIDNADVYGLNWGGSGFGEAEELLGKVLADAPHLREQMVLATKGGINPPTPYDSSVDYLIQACDDSLRRLNVDVIDLYQIHRPDMFSHPGQVAEALSVLRARGKIREAGVSNYTAMQYDALARHMDFALATTQPEFSAANLAPMRDGTFDLAMRDGVTPLAWSPLGGGSLATGQGLRPELVKVLDDLAAREGVDRAAIAIAFVLAHPSGPIAILGTQNLERLQTAPRATSVYLNRDDAYAIVQASEGVPLP